MSGGSDVVHPQGGVNNNFQDIVDTGHAEVESSYDQLITPIRLQFPITPNTPIQLENIPTSKVIIQNPLGNDPIYVGGLGSQTPYIDQAYPGDYRGTIVYEGMSVPFPVKNANRIQVVGTPLQSFNYRCYPNVTTVPETSTVTPPNPDTSGPSVFSTDPTDGATGVSRSINDIEIVFNEAILPGSVLESSFSITPTVPFTVFADPLNDEIVHISLAPVGGLLPQNTAYVVTVLAGGIKDLSENPIAANFDLNFTTEIIDITRPTVISHDPTPSGTTGVARDKTIVITMSEAIDPGSVTASTVTISPSVTVNRFVDGSNPALIKIDPTGNLAGSQLYTITLTAGGVKDLIGNAILNQFQFTFTTTASLPGADVTPPTITSRTPAPFATGVARNADVIVDFSEALSPASVTTSTFELFDPSNIKVPASVTRSNGDFRVTLNPTSNLSYSATYTMKVRVGVEDVALNNLAAESSWTFTVVAPLTITNRSPAVGATNVNVTSSIVIDFDEVLNTGTVTANTVELFDTSTNPDTEISYNRLFGNGNRRVTLDPIITQLKFSTTYEVFVRTGVLDVNGDNIGTSDIAWTFTTQAPPITILYNVSGSGTWRNFGDGTEIGRGLQIISTNTSAENSLYHDKPQKLTCKIRRVNSSGWSGRDDTLYCRIRNSSGDFKAQIGTYQDARTITTGSGGTNIPFENSGQTLSMNNGDCIFVEYEDGDEDHYFEINHTGSSVTSHSEEAFYGDDGNVHTGSSERDMGATIEGQV